MRKALDAELREARHLSALPADKCESMLVRLRIIYAGEALRHGFSVDESEGIASQREERLRALVQALRALRDGVAAGARHFGGPANEPGPNAA